MPAIQFTDFDLLVTSRGKGFHIRLLDSPAGQAEAAFSSPFTEDELEIFYLKVSRPRRGVRRIDSDEMQLAKRYGTRLFQAILKDEVYACFRSSLTAAQQDGKGLRIRLRLDAPALNGLPWEYLFDAAHNRFLSTSVETPVIRYFDLPQPARPLAVSPPLNIAVMISSPHDYPPLDVDHEWTQLVNALSPLTSSGMINLERIEPPNLEALQRRLRRKDYHIFHFIGHGRFDPATQDGVLLFEDDQGRGVAMSGQYMGTLLHDHKPLRLVVLNACEGARTSASDPFAGIAQGLIQQGLPSVIGMQFEITDQAAITFSQEFYSALVDGYPVDAALTEARKAIFARGNDTEWGTPVLFTRAPDGYIFQVESHQAPRPPTAASPGAVPPTAGGALEDTYLKGLSAFMLADWQLACRCFEQVVGEQADYEDAAEKLRQARLQLASSGNDPYRPVADLYRDALRLMNTANWEAARYLLEQVVTRQPGYQDAGSLLRQVLKRLEAAQAPPSPEQPAPKQKGAEPQRPEPETVRPPTSQPKPASAPASAPAVFTHLHGTLCVETLGGIATPLIWEGEKLPAAAAQVFTTANDSQSVVEIHLTFGGNSSVKDNLSLGKFSLEGIPPAPRGIPQIEVSFRVDEHLQLSVDAQDKARNYHQHSQVIDLSRLTPPPIISPLPPRKTTQPVEENKPAGSGSEAKDADFSDIFKEIFGVDSFGQRQRSQPPQRGDDLNFNIELSLAEAALGCEKPIEFSRRERCERCQGSGAEPPSQPETCPDCKGSGETRAKRQTILGEMVQVQTCPTCNGKGTSISKPCKHCHGLGFQERKLRKAVTFPAGVDSGNVVRLVGEGNLGLNGGSRGNLYLHITVKEHPMFVRRGDDLYLDYPLEEARIRKPVTIQVPLIEGGQAKLKVPMLVRSGTEITLPGKGAGKLKAKVRGDLRVVIQVYQAGKLSQSLAEQSQRILDALSR